ncbi:MAG: hypothetical protein ACI38O_11450 [Fibrobacter intestinalis]|uniref:Uncharacterized protein n=1 Tax=Fibrobacter intestinalis TaxID=28122 RepID=A0A1T4R063_9BACT|nr:MULTISPECIES: hypothetical protein [Fibrobacter]PBC75102.1 hypothetical protein BGW94_2785 [Fibrobacter sp. NR9]SKA09247.1 hypothetical protein SAMN02745108_02488 [Fibrobacter intestinalis]
MATYFIDAMVTKFSVEGENICFQIRGTENHLYRKKKEGEEDKFDEYNVFINKEIVPTDAKLYYVKNPFSIEPSNSNNLLISGAFFSNRKIRLETDDKFNVKKVSVGKDSI